jgi:hypothetical protein
LTNHGDAATIENLVNNTKPDMYQVILGTNKDFLSYQTLKHLADENVEITVTLPSVQKGIIQKNAILKKTIVTGIIQLVLLMSAASTKQSFHSNLKRIAVTVTYKNHKYIECFSRPEFS